MATLGWAATSSGQRGRAGGGDPMSVVENASPRRRLVAIGLAVVVVMVAAAAVAWSGRDASTPSSAPSTTGGPSGSALPRATMPRRVEPIAIEKDPRASYRVYLQRTETIGSLRV